MPPIVDNSLRDGMQKNEPPSESTSGARCARCGKLVPSAALSGNCASCLWELAYGKTDEATEAQEADSHRFGPYELIEEIARGGMGVVWRARQEGLGREVALKMILAGQLASSDQVLRFYTEAKAAARLDHPNIVPIYEIGEDQGRHFYSMKLIEGSSLAEALRDGRPFPPEQAARTVAAVARAIHFAHQRGVLHRDLKPSNILLDEDGSPFVADFGLARIAEGGSGATRADVILGTPAYMAPEQAAGTSRGVTTSADIYSLGAVLHEILTGKPPFQADTPLETLRLVLDSMPRPPSAINPGVDRDLEVICLKCLQKLPERRYPTAAELADDLERWIAGEPIHARPVSRFERAAAWARRKPELAMALCALSLVLALALAVSLVLYFGMRRESDARAVALQAEEAQRMAFQSLGVLKDNPGQALLLALEAAEQAPSLSSNNALLGALEVCREQRRLLDHESSVVQASFSPDGERIVTASRDGTGRIWNVKTGDCTAVLEGHDAALVTAQLSPDGTQVLTASADATARLWDARTGAMIRRFAGHSHALRSAGFSPDGKLILTVAQFTARLWSSATGEALHVLSGHADQVTCAAFAPGGEQVVTGSADKSIRVWDSSTGKEILSPLDAESVVYDVAFSSDGKRLGAALRNGAKVWDATTGKELSFLKGHKYDVYSIALSTDGTVAATGSEDFTARVWDVRTGVCLHVLRHGHKVVKVAMSPDNKLLATASYDTLGRVWDLKTGAIVSELRGHAALVLDAAFSPRGDCVVTACVDHTARLWRLRSRTPTTIADVPTARIIGAALAPDGETVVEIYGEGTAARVLAPASRTELRRLEGHKARLRAVCFSSDGSRILTGSTDNTARVWDAKTGEALHVLEGHSGPVHIVSFSADGKRMLTAADDGSARVWSTKDGSSLAVFGRGYRLVRSARFSPDGEHVAIVHQEGSGRIGDVSSAEARFLPRETFGFVTGLDFGIGGRSIVASRDDTRVVVYSLPGEKTIGTLVHPARVTVAACSPDRRWIVTQADDGVVRLWDALSHEEWLDIRKPECIPAALQFDASSRHAIVSWWQPLESIESSAVTVLSYPISPLETAREAKFGELTPDERDHFRAGRPEERHARREAWRGGQIYGQYQSGK